MNAFPIMLNLLNKKVVTVGGGNVARRKLQTLLKYDASIHVISPELHPDLKRLHEAKQFTWVPKHFEPEDIQDAFMVIAATNDAEVNAQVAALAPEQALINVATQPEQGNAFFTSHLKRGRLSISISTNGASPLLAKKIKDELSRVYDDRYEDYLDFLYECRRLLKTSDLTQEEKQRLLYDLLASNLLEPSEQCQMKQTLQNLISKEH
ncbi:precorrin-2 dehydrogenase [Pullulanibacillus camelliae]|uniref:precorrin-2 dehydrogenase n=1 Tax=Pullulanibacillus camelliae TaxID=1707096 RepID=A0A8J2YET7_9BACL|nr:NAD(P)-binding protein [Pullulanibacillus camelliae]GGE29407.1 precorrin-2 dehydrogenase [Pullulanibacillus camelliae]